MGRESNAGKTAGAGKIARPARAGSFPRYTPRPMHYDAHQPVIDELEARINTLRDSL